MHIPTSESPLVCSYITLFVGTIGNCILIETVITNANVAPHGFELFLKILTIYPMTIHNLFGQWPLVVFVDLLNYAKL